jgi:hypothetical protein
VLRNHAELVATASTVLVTVSASLLVAMSAPRTHERPERVPVPAPAVERAPQERASQYPVFAAPPTTRTPAHGPSRNEGEPGDRRGPNRGESRDHGRHVGEDADDQGENSDDQGEDGNANDQGDNRDDQGGNTNANDDQGDNQNASDGQGAGGSDDDQGDGGNSQD